MDITLLKNIIIIFFDITEAMWQRLVLSLTALTIGLCGIVKSDIDGILNNIAISKRTRKSPADQVWATGNQIQSESAHLANALQRRALLSKENLRSTRSRLYNDDSLNAQYFQPAETAHFERIPEISKSSQHLSMRAQTSALREIGDDNSFDLLNNEIEKRNRQAQSPLPAEISLTSRRGSIAAMQSTDQMINGQHQSPIAIRMRTFRSSDDDNLYHRQRIRIENPDKAAEQRSTLRHTRFPSFGGSDDNILSNEQAISFENSNSLLQEQSPLSKDKYLRQQMEDDDSNSLMEVNSFQRNNRIFLEQNGARDRNMRTHARVIHHQNAPLSQSASDDDTSWSRLINGPVPQNAYPLMENAKRERHINRASSFQDYGDDTSLTERLEIPGSFQSPDQNYAYSEHTMPQRQFISDDGLSQFETSAHQSSLASAMSNDLTFSDSHGRAYLNDVDQMLNAIDRKMMTATPPRVRTSDDDETWYSSPALQGRVESTPLSYNEQYMELQRSNNRNGMLRNAQMSVNVGSDDDGHFTANSIASRVIEDNFARRYPDVSRRGRERLDLIHYNRPILGSTFPDVSRANSVIRVASSGFDDDMVQVSPLSKSVIREGQYNLGQRRRGSRIFPRGHLLMPLTRTTRRSTLSRAEQRGRPRRYRGVRYRTTIGRRLSSGGRLLRGRQGRYTLQRAGSPRRRTLFF